MRILNHYETLIYYDGPELFIARDQLDVPYVCLLVEHVDDESRYISVPISEARLNELSNGELDLLTVLSNPETAEAFVGSVSEGNFKEITTIQIPLREIPPSWYPDSGLYLEPPSITDIQVINECQERKRAVIHWALNPPEARQYPKISAEHLGQATKLAQRLVKYAFKKSLRYVDDVTKDAIDDDDNYKLEVFAFSPGSFTLHMQTVAPADMFGYAQVEKAMRIIDEIHDYVDNPDEAVEIVSHYGGHLATAYRDLLQFVVENDIPLSYEWSMPDREDSTKRRITSLQAKPIYDALLERTDLGKEEKRIIGIVRKADEDRGTWRISSEEDNKEYNGRSDPSVVGLEGIIIGHRYEFVCEEILIEQRGTGRESTVFNLISYRLLS